MTAGLPARCKCFERAFFQEVEKVAGADLSFAVDSYAFCPRVETVDTPAAEGAAGAFQQIRQGDTRPGFDRSLELSVESGRWYAIDRFRTAGESGDFCLLATRLLPIEVGYCTSPERAA